MTSTRTARRPSTDTAHRQAGRAGPATRAPLNRRGGRVEPSLLADLGVLGLGSSEPAILAALISREPLLLVGPHGTGKTYLLTRIAAALGLEFRHYNASLLNYDDLVGFPVPDGRGGIDYARTPASAWDAEAILFDEISRCRPDLQNKLFPILYERKVQGLPLERLVYRWAAMNPPSADDEGSTWDYRGSEPLDPALADRFAFIVEFPGWGALTADDQEALIARSNEPVSDAAATRLASVISRGREWLPRIYDELSPRGTVYVRILMGLLADAGIHLTPRRAATLLRNVVAVHTALLVSADDNDPARAAAAALAASLPSVAEGHPVDHLKAFAAHREAWLAAGFDAADVRRLLLGERDPLRRALLAADAATLPRGAFSTIIADALADMGSAGRHALAVHLVETGRAGRLVAAVAEQCAILYKQVALPQAVHEAVAGRSTRHDTWRAIEGVLARRPAGYETDLITNLLLGAFGTGELTSPGQVADFVNGWEVARAACRGGGV